MFGTVFLGQVDQIPGLCYVKTKFVILFVIFLPIQSYLVLDGTEKDQGLKGVEIPLSWKSVFWGWARLAALLAACLLAIMTLVYFGKYDREGGGHLITGLVCLFSLVGLLVGAYVSLAATHASPERARELLPILGLDPAQVLPRYYSGYRPSVPMNRAPIQLTAEDFMSENPVLSAFDEAEPGSKAPPDESRLVRCPHCQQCSKVSTRHAVKALKCPACGGIFAAAKAEPVSEVTPAPPAPFKPSTPLSPWQEKEPHDKPSLNGLVYVVVGLAVMIAVVGVFAVIRFSLGEPTKSEFMMVGGQIEDRRSEQTPRPKKKTLPFNVQPRQPVVPADGAPINPTELAGVGVSRDWQVLFRSFDPSDWNQNVDKGPKRMARPLSQAPDDMGYLRLRNDRDYVIVKVAKQDLSRFAERGRFHWNGKKSSKMGAYHLGVLDRSTKTVREAGAVSVHDWPLMEFAGWGFGHICREENRQGYSWNGKTIAPKVLEIAVKAGTLTPEEIDHLLPKPIKTEPIKPERLAGPGISNDWNVVFCSADPAIWNTDVNEGPSRFAKSLNSVAENIRYLRLRRKDDFVIVPISKQGLTQRGEGRFSFEGRNLNAWSGRHLGVVDTSFNDFRNGEVCIAGRPPYGKGWGFGHFYGLNNKQAYSWGGSDEAPFVMEIAVKAGRLTKAEEEKLRQNGVKADPIAPVALEGPNISKDWQVLFRSANPRIWNSTIDAPGEFARALDAVAGDIRYLRIRRHADYVIIPMTNERLRQTSQQGRYGWNGDQQKDSDAFHLGVFDSKLPCGIGDIAVRGKPDQSGWGFGHIHTRDDVQGYCWYGKNLYPTEMEIAVKKGELTDKEKQKLLVEP